MYIESCNGVPFEKQANTEHETPRQGVYSKHETHTEQETPRQGVYSKHETHTEHETPRQGVYSKHETHTEQETFELGYKFANELVKGDAISLEGDLGTGKTAFTKGIASGLGVTEHITSPTFTLVNTYLGHTTLHHFDVYRVNDPDELLAIGWEEYFTPESITVIEWGDLVSDILPDNIIRVRFSRIEAMSEGRSITIER